jgi:hypothetical protein
LADAGRGSLHNIVVRYFSGATPQGGGVRTSDAVRTNRTVKASDNMTGVEDRDPPPPDYAPGLARELKKAGCEVDFGPQARAL